MQGASAHFRLFFAFGQQEIWISCKTIFSKKVVRLASYSRQLCSPLRAALVLQEFSHGLSVEVKLLECGEAVQDADRHERFDFGIPK